MTAQAVIFTPAARQSQSDFREALECLSRPGRIGTVGESAFPITKARHAYSLLRALADQEVSIGVFGTDEAVQRFASLGTGSRLAPIEEANYALFLSDPEDMLGKLRTGDLEVPERGATAIVLVAAIGEGDPYVLRGPGVRDVLTVRITGLGEAALRARDAACEEYPLGIDLFLVDAAGRLLGLPRTTRIEPEVI